MIIMVDNYKTLLFAHLPGWRLLQQALLQKPYIFHPLQSLYAKLNKENIR